jgi:hypothetical protein
MSFRMFPAVSLALCLCGILPAATSMIGVAMANGKFLLDRSEVVGNANIFDGSVVQTGKAMSDLSLTSGLKMRLAMDSRGKVFHDRLVIEQGAGQVSGSKYLVEARGLRVIAIGTDATVRVALGPEALVEVAAVTGAFQVETLAGIRVANMPPGTALSFTEEGGASMPTVLCGKPSHVNGKFVLTDKTTRVTVELTGISLDEFAGRSISVTGNMAGSGVLHVLSAKRSACGGAAAKAGETGAAGAGAAGAGAAGAGAAGAGAAGAGAAGAAAAGAGAAVGLSTAAIAGIAVAGAVGLGLGVTAAAGGFSSPPASK